MLILQIYAIHLIAGYASIFGSLAFLSHKNGLFYDPAAVFYPIIRDALCF